MSRLLIQKIAVKLAVDHNWIVKCEELPAYWQRTPSNLAYRLRMYTGWNIKARRLKDKNVIHFTRFPSVKKTKQN